MRNFLAASLLAVEAFLTASNLSCLLLSNKSIFYLLILMIQLQCCTDYASENNVSLLTNCRVQLILLQRYAFLLKDARNYWKMFESEGDNKKSKEKRLFCCHYQNIYVLLQKQKTRGHHQHRIIWERALPGLRCKDKNKNGIYQRFFRKSFLGR